MEKIEKEEFVVKLDELKYEFDERDKRRMEKYGKIIMNGKGYESWFEKYLKI
jgi:carnitine O-palmitoyltransferase 1